jgi:anti-sigma factor RsiW
VIFSFTGHIGTRVSALVDGQLSPAEEERAWSHVLACAGCRRLVEHEGWTKRQLGSLSGAAPRDAVPPQLVGSLYDVREVADAWATVEGIERRSARRRTATVLVGGGAVGAAVLGLVAVTGPTLGRGEPPTRPSPATIRSDSGAETRTGSPTWVHGSTPTALVRRSR